MEFKSITLNDKDIMNAYLLENNYGICSYSFANIFIWQGVYKTTYCIHDDFLILRSVLPDGHPAFSMPLGRKDKSSILKYLADYSKNEYGEFIMISLTPEMSSELIPVLGENFKISQKPEWSDYIYLSENMINLSGKSFSAKRNHINKFFSIYGDRYEYEKINTAIVPECKEMNKKWCEERDCKNADTDFCAIQNALDNFDALELKGGAVRIDGEIIAFTLGQPNNSEVFDILAEKALSGFEGIYQFINREFASNECAAYTYINREEDLGIEGLQKAKLSYKPFRLLEKNIGRFVGK